MSQDWLISGPRVLDVGGETEQVRHLKVAIVGGHIDVVTHDDSPAARLEVSSIQGEPLRVRWDGSTLAITHGKDGDGILDRITRPLGFIDRNKVVISLSVPQDAEARVSTVSAGALVAGIHGSVRTNTVSGALTLDDLVGEVDVNTVSGDVECNQLEGPLRVNSVSGSVTAQLSRLPQVSIHTVSGDVALDLVDGSCSVTSNSVSGDVTVRAPHHGYDVRAHTASGQVVVDGQDLKNGPGSRGGNLRSGDGSLRVKANAVSGNVVILGRGQSTGAHDDEQAV